MLRFFRSKRFALTVAGIVVVAFVVPAGGLPGVLGLIALGGGAWFVLRETPKRKKQRLYQELLSLSGGDSNRAARLIALEAQRRPRADRAAHIRSAIQRLRRDLN